MAAYIRNALRRVVYSRASERLLHGLHGRLPRIITYHRFRPSTIQAFDRQCAYLRRHYNPVSIDNIVASVRDGDALPPRSLAVTIDDGYRDAYDLAAPVLKRYGLDTTLYAVSGFLDGECWMWWDRIEYAFLKTKRTHVELNLPEDNRFRLELGDSAQRKTEAHRLCSFLVRRDNSESDRWCEDVARQLEVTVPSRAEPPYDAISWDQARELEAQGFTIGSHTRNHWVLGTIQADETKHSEIAHSRERIQAMLDRPVDHFCFPNGGIGDFSRADVERIRRAGYSSAATLLIGFVRPSSDRFRLPRINVDAGFDLDFFRIKIAGLFRYGPVNFPEYGTTLAQDHERPGQ